MTTQPEAGAGLDSLRGVSEHAAGNLGHLATALATHVLVVGAAGFIAGQAVAEVDARDVAMFLEHGHRPENCRVIAAADHPVDLAQQLLQRPGSMLRALEELAQRVADGAGPGHGRQPTTSYLRM